MGDLSCIEARGALGWTKHSPRLLELFNIVRLQIACLPDMLLSLVLVTRWTDLLETFVVIVKELGEVEDLPAVLAREVICQRLQLVEHDIFHVVVWEEGVKYETVLLC